MYEDCCPPEAEPFARWNPARRVWETPTRHPECGHWAPFCQAWPTSGSMRAGACSAPPTSAPRTAANACSCAPGTRRPAHETLLKTPTANLGTNGGSQHPTKRKAGGHGPTLADEIEHLLPTPRASDGAKGSPNQRYRNGSQTLASTAAGLPAAQPPTDAEKDGKLLPTPTSADAHGGAGTTPKRQGGMNLRTAVSRLPNGGEPTSPPSADGKPPPDVPPPHPPCPAPAASPPTSSNG
jgi:hypothetical protein